MSRPEGEGEALDPRVRQLCQSVGSIEDAVYNFRLKLEAAEQALFEDTPFNDETFAAWVELLDQWAWLEHDVRQARWRKLRLWKPPVAEDGR